MAELMVTISAMTITRTGCVAGVRKHHCNAQSGMTANSPQMPSSNAGNLADRIELKASRHGKVRSCQASAHIKINMKSM